MPEPRIESEMLRIKLDSYNLAVNVSQLEAYMETGGVLPTIAPIFQLIGDEPSFSDVSYGRAFSLLQCLYAHLSVDTFSLPEIALLIQSMLRTCT